MRRILRLLTIGFCVAFAMTLSGCSGSKGGKAMKKFYSSEIVFPSSLERIEGESGRHFDPNSPGVRFVVYVDSVQCSSCHLNRMPKYSEYAYLETLYPDFQLVAIMWPNAESAPTMAADIAHRDFPFDVFLDKDGSFVAANPTIPSNRDAHCFLLDRDGHPIFTGDPVSTKGKGMLLHNTLYSVYGQK